MKNIKKIPPDSAVLSGVEGSTKNQQHKQSDNEKQQKQSTCKKKKPQLSFSSHSKKKPYTPPDWVYNAPAVPSYIGDPDDYDPEILERVYNAQPPEKLEDICTSPDFCEQFDGMSL